MRSHDIIDYYVIRSPLFSLNTWYTQFTGNYRENILNLFSNEIIKEAIYISSPDFYYFLYRKENKIREKEFISLTKYLSRLTYRCTPFGLFAGINIGEFYDGKNIITRNEEKKIAKKLIRLDNAFLSELIEKLKGSSNIHKYLIYKVNSTLYEIANQYRYVEYEFGMRKKRRYILSQICKTPCLEELLNKSKNGITYREIELIFLNNGATKKEAKTAFYELVHNQVITTNIDISVTDPFLLQTILKIFQNNHVLDKDITVFINEAVKYSQNNDSCANIEQILNIKDLAFNLGIKFNENNLFQVDYLTNYCDNRLSYDVRKEVKHTASFLAAFSSIKSSTIDSFCKKFEQRYGSQTIDLVTALDPDLGIGYPVDQEFGMSNSICPIFNNISFPSEIRSTNVQWNWVCDLILKKYLDFLDNKNDVINFEWEDIPIEYRKISFNQNSFACIIQYISGTEKDLCIYFRGIGKNAIQLTARFAYLDKKILSIIKDFAQLDNIHSPETIFAEILHIPENRLGNIAQHPPIYDYEIPYLSRSTVSSNNIIDINDLSLRIVKKKLLLFSKKNNKEVIPRLCNAHYYQSSSLPIYRFLCDFEDYKTKTSSSFFEWPVVLSECKYLPRVVFGNSIISKACWRINYIEVKDFFNEPEYIGMEKFEKWRIKRAIPELITFSTGDNELLLNIKEWHNIKILLNAIKQYNNITVNEFLYADRLLSQIEEIYTNEILVLFKKK